MRISEIQAEFLNGYLERTASVDEQMQAIEDLLAEIYRLRAELEAAHNRYDITRIAFDERFDADQARLAAVLALCDDTATLTDDPYTFIRDIRDAATGDVS